MRIGNLSRKAVIAVLVGCTAYVACFRTNDEDVCYYSSTIEDVMKDGYRYGVTDAKELGSSAGIRGLPDLKVREVSGCEESLALLAEDGREWFLVRVAKGTFLDDNDVEDIGNGILRMEGCKGGLLSFLAGDVSSIIMPEHWRPCIKSHAIKIGKNVRGMFKALKGALRHCDNSSGKDRSKEMMKACKNSIVEILEGVFQSEERVSKIVTALDKAGIDSALKIFSSDIVRGNDDKLKRVESKITCPVQFSRDGGELYHFIMDGVEEGSVDYPFARIALEVLRFISMMARLLFYSLSPINDDSKDQYAIKRSAACNAEKIIFVLEVASAKGVEAIKGKYSMDWKKHELLKNCVHKEKDLPGVIDKISRDVKEVIVVDIKRVEGELIDKIDIIDKKFQDRDAELSKKIDDLKAEVSKCKEMTKPDVSRPSRPEVTSAPVADPSVAPVGVGAAGDNLYLAEKRGQKRQRLEEDKEDDAMRTRNREQSRSADRNSDSPVSRYPVSGGAVGSRLYGGVGYQNRPFRRTRETPRHPQQQQSLQPQYGSGSGYSVSPSASQLSSSNPIPPPSGKSDGSYGYWADSKHRRVY